MVCSTRKNQRFVQADIAAERIAGLVDRQRQVDAAQIGWGRCASRRWWRRGQRIAVDAGQGKLQFYHAIVAADNLRHVALGWRCLGGLRLSRHFVIADGKPLTRKSVSPTPLIPMTSNNPIAMVNHLFFIVVSFFILDLRFSIYEVISSYETTA